MYLCSISGRIEITATYIHEYSTYMLQYKVPPRDKHTIVIIDGLVCSTHIAHTTRYEQTLQYTRENTMYIHTYIHHARLHIFPHTYTAKHSTAPRLCTYVYSKTLESTQPMQYSEFSNLPHLYPPNLLICHIFIHQTF